MSGFGEPSRQMYKFPTGPVKQITNNHGCFWHSRLLRLMQLSVPCPTIPLGLYVGNTGVFDSLLNKRSAYKVGNLTFDFWSLYFWFTTNSNIFNNIPPNPHQEQGLGGDLITQQAPLVGHLITSLIKSPPPYSLPQVGQDIDRCIAIL